MTTQWIATRVLTAPNGETIEISLGIPYQDSKGMWLCPIRYVRNGHVEEKMGFGVDAFQALIVALGRISLEWQGRAWWPLIGKSYSGFPKIVDGDPELIDHDRLYKMIDEEMERQSTEALAKKRAEKKQQ
jgi:hypothetical protein